MFDRIVLNIPHSVPLAPVTAKQWNDPATALRASDRWTDWDTHRLFASADERVIPVRFLHSRFECDAERLPGDPMETQGQGIIYTRFGTGLSRKVSRITEAELMHLYWEHTAAVRSLSTPGSLVVDCHSFPADLADTDVCIGYNEDDSYPEDAVRVIRDWFTNFGYKVSENTPYSNAFLGGDGSKSVMLEINKRLYMTDEKRIDDDKFAHLHDCIEGCYLKLLT